MCCQKMYKFWKIMYKNMKLYDIHYINHNSISYIFTTLTVIISHIFIQMRMR